MTNSMKHLLKNGENRRWLFKTIGKKFLASFTTFISLWTLLEAFDINLTETVEKIISGGALVVLAVSIVICACVAMFRGIAELKDYLHLRVEPSRSGCSVEIRVADSYLTNAFVNYPNCAMVIGLNKAFWFQEAEPGSLVADMWSKLKEKGITKEEVQEKIDKALEALWTRNGVVDEELKAKYIDQTRPKVYVRCSGVRENAQRCRSGCTYENACLIRNTDDKSELKTECRDNYKIGTMIGIHLCWTEKEREVQQKLVKLIPGAVRTSLDRTRYNVSAAADWLLGIKRSEQYREQNKKPEGFFKYIRTNRYKKISEKKMGKMLYLLANAEVVQGHTPEAPIKVTFDRNASAIENFSKIWEYFEKRKAMTPMPPSDIIYQPLLIPLIGAGVANEGYSDMEIFSKIVDLYYEDLRKNVRPEKHPAIPHLIINIQSKTAIEFSDAAKDNTRQIDLKTAFWYLKYRNKASPVVSKE